MLKIKWNTNPSTFRTSTNIIKLGYKVIIWYFFVSPNLNIMTKAYYNQILMVLFLKKNLNSWKERFSLNINSYSI